MNGPRLVDAPFSFVLLAQLRNTDHQRGPPAVRWELDTAFAWFAQEKAKGQRFNVVLISLSRTEVYGEGSS